MDWYVFFPPNCLSTWIIQTHNLPANAPHFNRQGRQSGRLFTSNVATHHSQSRRQINDQNDVFLLFCSAWRQTGRTEQNISFRTMWITLLLSFGELHCNHTDSCVIKMRQNPLGSCVCCFFLMLLHACVSYRRCLESYRLSARNGTKWVKGPPPVPTGLTVSGLSLFSTSAQDYPIALLCLKQLKDGEERVCGNTML